MWFRLPAQRIAAGHSVQAKANTFMYLFEWESPLIGAAHAMDLMVFGNGLPFAILAGFADYDRTAAFMRQAWVRFATEGNPSTPEFSWPHYNEQQAAVSINESPTVRHGSWQESALIEKVIAGSWLDMGL